LVDADLGRQALERGHDSSTADARWPGECAFRPGGCSIATVSWIAMSLACIAATVWCGRHSRQSRKRVVDAMLVTCKQRDAETPTQA